MGIYEIPKTELIERAAKELQKNAALQPPSWAMFAKTGMCKQRPPARDDWWFVRAAAILRRLSDTEGPIGVQKLRTLYGGKKNRGHKPERFYPGSGNIIRKILQQLEKAGFAKRLDKGLHKGRIITPQGHSFMGKIANAYMKEHNIVLPKMPEGELNISDLPKEKKARTPKARKKPVITEGVPAATEAAAPKKPRAPRKPREPANKEATPNVPAPEAAVQPSAPSPEAQKPEQTSPPTNQ